MAVLLYIAVFARLTFGLYDRLAYMAFDLGIFDQAVWFISRGQTPFVTVRGLHILADHFSALLYLLAPLYWLWPSPKMLLLAQTVALSLGALPVYGLARHKTGSAPTALLFAAAYLLYPALQWSNTYEFHPDTFATPALLGAFFYLTRRRWIPYFLLLAVALLTKETVGLTVAALGVYALLFARERRIGLLTIGLGALGVVVALETVRAFNHGTPSPYIWLYAHWGDSPLAIAGHLLRHPVSTFQELNNEGHRLYFLQLLVPVLFLSLLAPEAFLIAAPALLSNLLSSRPFMHGTDEYYTALITPWVFVAAITGYARVLRRWPWRLGGEAGRDFIRTALLANLALWSLGGTYWGPLWKSREAPLYFDASPLSGPAVEDTKRLLAQIPPDAPVSAQMALVPQLSHRAVIYTFPNPFSQNGWGGTLKARREIESVTGSELPAPADLDKAIAEARDVEYVALCPVTSRFPLGFDNYMTATTAVLRHPAYGIVAVGDTTLVLRRGASHANGLRLLARSAGRPARQGVTPDAEKAFWAWYACGQNAALKDAALVFKWGNILFTTGADESGGLTVELLWQA